MPEGPVLNPPDIPDCFVCGPANPEGLGLTIRAEGTDAVARFRARPAHQGWPDRLHGGVLALLLDEMLVYAGATHDLWGMTASVSYRLRRPVPLNAELLLRGRLIRRSGRGYRAAATAHLPDGTLAAEGEGLCVLRERA